MNTGRRTRVAADAKIGDAAMTRLLSQRFGDGLVYIAEDSDRELLQQAMANGLVSGDGHLTSAGHRLLKRSLRD